MSFRFRKTVYFSQGTVRVYTIYKRSLFQMQKEKSYTYIIIFKYYNNILIIKIIFKFRIL